MATNERNVTPLLKIKIADCPPTDSCTKRGDTVLTLWRPDSFASDNLLEGKRMKIYGLVPVKRTFTDNSTVQLNNSKATRYSVRFFLNLKIST